MRCYWPSTGSSCLLQSEQSLALFSSIDHRSSDLIHGIDHRVGIHCKSKAHSLTKTKHLFGKQQTQWIQQSICVASNLHSTPNFHLKFGIDLQSEVYHNFKVSQMEITMKKDFHVLSSKGSHTNQEAHILCQLNVSCNDFYQTLVEVSHVLQPVMYLLMHLPILKSVWWHF